MRDRDKQLSKSYTQVVLDIFSPKLTADEVSRIFDIKTSDPLHKGVRTRQGKEGKHWILSSKKFVDSKYLESHLDWLVGAMFDKRLAINKLCSHDCSIKVRCLLNDWTGLAAPEFSPSVLARFAQLRVPVQVIYRYMDLDWSESV